MGLRVLDTVKLAGRIVFLSCHVYSAAEAGSSPKDQVGSFEPIVVSVVTSEEHVGRITGYRIVHFG